MRVVVLVAIVGDSVESPGGDGTLTAGPPLGAPNGYRFGSVEEELDEDELAADELGVGDGAPVAGLATTSPMTSPAAPRTAMLPPIRSGRRLRRNTCITAVATRFVLSTRR
jgi:hypothetical protein